MNEHQLPTALITGASSGIGYELAKIFAREKYDLVILSRHRDKLQAVADELTSKYGTNVYILPKDLSVPNAAQEIVDELTQQSITVDVLVNDAGFGVYGWFAETDLQEELGLMQVNMVALVHLTKLLLSGMLARKNGKILQVGSLAGFVPGPLAPLYYASKAFVLSFTESLANQLEGTGVTTAVLCPGPTKTHFFDRVKAEEPKGHHIKTPYNHFMKASDVAEVGYRGLMNGNVIIYPNSGYHLAIVAARLIPRNWLVKIVRGGQKV